MKKINLLFIIILVSHIGSIGSKVDQTINANKTDFEINSDPSANPQKAIDESGFQIVASEKTDRTSLTGPVLFSIDKVVAIIDGPERRHIICQSELERLGIDGRKPQLNDLIIEELIYQDAVKHKVPIDDYADRYIRSIKKAHNIGDKEVDRIFEGAGLSPEEGRTKLQKMGANTTMLDLKVKARIFIPQHDIENYFNQNPKYKEERYEIEVAFVPFFSHESQKQQDQLAYLKDQIETKSLDVMWGVPFWIKKTDIAEDKMFITCMKPGDISLPQRVQNGFEIYRMKDKKERRLVPLQRRVRRIVDILREPKFKEMFDIYVKELFNTASIIYVKEE
jgi:hypothetical protein